MAENVLEITEKGQYKNIDLKQMNDGDSIVFTKKYAEAYGKEYSKGTAGTPEFREWTGYSAAGTYKDAEVGFFFPGGYSSEGYVSAEDLATAYNEVGGEGDTIRITCKKGLTKNKKNADVVALDFTFVGV